VAACGDDDADGAEASADVADQLDELAELDEPLSDELVEQAETEGELVVYTSNSDLEDLVPAFEERFDVDVELYRANSEEVLQRVVQEHDAGRPQADLVENLLGEMEVLAGMDLLVPYDTPLRDELRPEARFEEWTATRFNAFVVAWNEEVLGDAPPPTEWTDLAEEPYASLLALEIGDYDWYMTLHQALLDQGLEEAEVDAFFERLGSSARAVDGHTAQAELLSAGEFGVVASAYSHSIDEATDAGAPVRWEPAVEPVIIKPAGVGVLGSARHPAAAALFVEWFLTEGQELLVDGFRIPALDTAEDPLAGVDVVPVDADRLLEEGEEWRRRYEELLG
jgi:iron(III) transport system substrate-binding protein